MIRTGVICLHYQYRTPPWSEISSDPELASVGYLYISTLVRSPIRKWGSIGHHLHPAEVCVGHETPPSAPCDKDDDGMLALTALFMLGVVMFGTSAWL